MPKIVAVDTDFEDNNLEEAMARDAGIEFEITRGRTAQAVIDGLLKTGADAAVTSYAMFPREVFEACPNLKAVSRTGVGYDEIDVEAATEHGVAVCNVPGYGTEVVSDHAIALALACLRRINEIDADMRAGIWDFHRRRPLGQVHGRTFGVVGYGNIGRAVARKARGWERSIDTEIALVEEQARKYDKVRVAISCSSACSDMFDELEERVLAQVDNAVEVIRSGISADLLVHTGPEIVGIAIQGA